MTVSRGIRQRLTIRDVREIQRMRATGYSTTEVADILDWSERTVRYYAPPVRVPIAPLREAFERSGLIAADVARTLDWYDYNGRADGHRVKRALGIIPSGFGRGYGNKRIRSTSYERALMLADAIGIDPVDVGL